MRWTRSHIKCTVEVLIAAMVLDFIIIIKKEFSKCTAPQNIGECIWYLCVHRKLGIQLTTHTTLIAIYTKNLCLKYVVYMLDSRICLTKNISNEIIFPLNCL
jgi:hypothetical protein